MIIQNTMDKIARTEHTEDKLFNEPIGMNNQDIYQINFDTELQVMNKLATRNLIVDESYVLDKFRHIFDTSWNEISLGEEPVSDYINFCQNRQHFKPENWKISNMQFRYSILNYTFKSCNLSHRERYLNFICSLEMMEDIPMKTLFTMLKQNLGKAQMLTYVFVFNTPSWVEELEFVYGANDKEQWKVSIYIRG